MAGRYEDRVKSKSGLLEERAWKDLAIDGRKVCRQDEIKSGLLEGRAGKDFVIDGRKICRQSEDQDWAAGRESLERYRH